MDPAPEVFDIPTFDTHAVEIEVEGDIVVVRPAAGDEIIIDTTEWFPAVPRVP